MNLIKTIPWGMIFGSLSIQLILLFIASFFTDSSIPYFYLLKITFTFYIIISVIIKINIIYKLLYNIIAFIAYFILTIYAIYIIYSQYLDNSGFITCTIVSLIIVLVYKTMITILVKNKNNEETTNNTSWRNRLRKYEENN